MNRKPPSLLCKSYFARGRPPELSHPVFSPYYFLPENTWTQIEGRTLPGPLFQFVILSILATRIIFLAQKLNTAHQSLPPSSLPPTSDRLRPPSGKVVGDPGTAMNSPLGRRWPATMHNQSAPRSPRRVGHWPRSRRVGPLNRPSLAGVVLIMKALGASVSKISKTLFASILSPLTENWRKQNVMFTKDK